MNRLKTCGTTFFFYIHFCSTQNDLKAIEQPLGHQQDNTNATMATDEASTINIASRIRQFSAANSQTQQELDGNTKPLPHKKPSPLPRRRPQTTEVNYNINNNNNNVNNNNNNKPAINRKAVNRSTSSPVRPKKPVVPVKPETADHKSPLPSLRPINSNNKDSNRSSSYNNSNNDKSMVNKAKNTTNSNSNNNSGVDIANDKNRRTSTSGIKPAIPAKPTTIPPPAFNNNTKSNVNLNTNKSTVVASKPQFHTTNKTQNSSNMNNSNSSKLGRPGAGAPMREKSWKQIAGPPSVALPSGPASVARMGIIGIDDNDQSKRDLNEGIQNIRNNNISLRGSNSGTLSGFIIPGTVTNNNTNDNDEIEEYTNQKILKSPNNDNKQVPPKPLRGQQCFEVYEMTHPNDPSSSSVKIVSNRSQCRRETLDGQMILGGPMEEVSMSTSSQRSSSCKFLFIIYITSFITGFLCILEKYNYRSYLKIKISISSIFYQ